MFAEVAGLLAILEPQNWGGVHYHEVYGKFCNKKRGQNANKKFSYASVLYFPETARVPASTKALAGRRVSSGIQ